MELIYKIIRLLVQKRGHGFSPDITLASQTEEDYVFGDGQLEAKLGVAEIRPDGQWDNFLPPMELQHYSWGDTYHCTVYGTENMVQTLQKAKYGEIDEHTERYLGVLAKIRNKVGGSPHTVMEMWRKNGNLPYAFLPFDTPKSWSEFNSPNPMTVSLINEGKKWLDKWTLGHDWIRNFSHASLKEALKYSPLGVGVYAWYNKDGSDIYSKPSWAQDNHWVMVYGYVENKYWKVYDTYGTGLKKLDWNYPFAFAKRITLEKKTMTEQDKRKKGEDLYNSLAKKGRQYVQVVSDGAVYEISGMDLTYHFWATDSPFFQLGVDNHIRANVKSGKLIGISPEDFAALSDYVAFKGGSVETRENKIQGIINNLQGQLRGDMGAI